MMIRNLLVAGLFTVCSCLFLLTLLPGCANIVPPSGGPRDSLPPRLASAEPADSALGVNTQKIILNFDEFIELKSPAEQILVSPFPQKAPQYDSRLRTLTIRLKDSLLPATTYVIDFGQAIVDLNEGNVMKNVRYVFSTGDHIDTLQLSGRILSAETGNADSTLLALLYRESEDSTVCNKLPFYITRLDGAGKFRFVNLPSGTYHVFGLQDADGNKKYTPPYEQFAFLDTPITVNEQSPFITLYAYREEKEKQRALSGGQGKKLIFTNNLEGGVHNDYDTLVFEYNKPLVKVDPQLIRLREDSVAKDQSFSLAAGSDSKQIRIQSNWKRGASYKIYFDTAYAVDSSGYKSSVKDTFAFRVRSAKEFGSLRIRLKNLLLSRQPVLLFYVGERVVLSYPLNSPEFFRSDFPSGNYRIGILYDDNGNGRWDPGRYFQTPRRQPERVLYLEKTISVRAEWDNEVQYELPVQQ